MPKKKKGFWNGLKAFVVGWETHTIAVDASIKVYFRKKDTTLVLSINRREKSRNSDNFT